MKKNILSSLFFLHLSVMVFSQSFQEQIESIKQNHDLMGGVALVICNGEITQSVPFGLADFGRNIPVTDETVFRIASISKVVTTIAFMQLVEQELVSLDDDISTILGFQVRNPNFPERVITPRMLLAHTSTLRDGSTYSNFLSATFSQSQVPQLSQLLSPGGSFYTSGQFLSHEPGTFFTYANINSGIIGTLVEILSETRFDIYCRDNILQPLGIEGSFLPTELPDINKVAVLYRKVNNNWVPQVDNFQGVYPSAGNLGTYVPGTNALRLSPQGGLRASGNDLAKILLMLMNRGAYNDNRIINESSVDQMFSMQWHYDGNNGNNYYGLFRSWGLGIHRITGTPGNDLIFSDSDLMFGHSGEAYGLVSNAYIDTINKIGLVFMTNGNGTGYTSNTLSAFYTVENEVFNVIENEIEGSQCGSVGFYIPDLMEDNLHVFPNPVNDFVALKGELSRYRYSIFNTQGIAMKSGIISGQEDLIDVRQLLPGIYFLRIGADSGQVLKLIKN